MAKSTGNIARVADVLAKGVSPRALRYALISVHYRQGLNYTAESQAAASGAIDRLDAVVAALAAYGEERQDDPELPPILERAVDGFFSAMDDDLNISPALAALFDLVRELNRRIDLRLISTEDARRAEAALRQMDGVLAILPDPVDELDPEVSRRLDARARARADRDWAASDRLRDELAGLGITVEDTRDGQRWRRTVESGLG